MRRRGHRRSGRRRAAEHQVRRIHADHRFRERHVDVHARTADRRAGRRGPIRHRRRRRVFTHRDHRQALDHHVRIAAAKIVQQHRQLTVGDHHTLVGPLDHLAGSRAHRIDQRPFQVHAHLVVLVRGRVAEPHRHVVRPVVRHINRKRRGTHVIQVTRQRRARAPVATVHRTAQPAVPCRRVVRAIGRHPREVRLQGRRGRAEVETLLHTSHRKNTLCQCEHVHAREVQLRIGDVIILVVAVVDGDTGVLQEGPEFSLGQPSAELLHGQFLCQHGDPCDVRRSLAGAGIVCRTASGPSADNACSRRKSVRHRCMPLRETDDPVSAGRIVDRTVQPGPCSPVVRIPDCTYRQ